MSTDVSRPLLTPDLTAAELLRWYWLRAELSSFARSLGLRSGGAKADLTRRIAAHLAGTTPPAPSPARPRPGPLPEPLTAATPIPAGQPCTQQVRRWLADAVGPQFRFDAAMRTFFASGDGSRTLGDAAAHWHRSRSRPRRPIDPQFELNRFTRQWHLDHPGGSRAELLAAWADYRALPLERRAGVQAVTTT